MKTTLHFEGPEDFSVGTIRIAGEGGTVADWVATPDNRGFLAENITPGLYATEIGPAGVTPQSVVFEVRPGEDNRVFLPPFSTLSASGSTTSFFDTSRLQTHAGIPEALLPDVARLLSRQGEGSASPPRRESLHVESTAQLRISDERSLISIGLSETGRGRDSFATFSGRSRMEMFAGRVELDIPDDPERRLWAARRVRMTAAIQRVRIEHCLLPLYRGGTKITVSTPPFATADVALNITPIDPHSRALLRALDAGTRAEARAVRHDIVGERMAAAAWARPDNDPWAAILMGLLAIRFPDVFEPLESSWATSLLRQAGWAFDTYVIKASQILSAARDQGSDAQDQAVADSAALLTRAQTTGSPYYRYTGQLFAEMAAGIADYLKSNRPDAGRGVEYGFSLAYARWRRNLPLQRGAGPTFTWLAIDRVASRERALPVPHRRPSGRLKAADTTVVFEGELHAGKITLLGSEGHGTRRRLMQQAERVVERTESVGVPDTRLPGLPALRRPVRIPDDPNKDRFGGVARCGGFSLSAGFEPANSRDWATVVLTVEAEDPEAVGIEDFAWFALHPTFSPSTVKVLFRGSRAQLRLQAWGGFTVGVWIPKGGIELECDLAAIESAPLIIRTR